MTENAKSWRGCLAASLAAVIAVGCGPVEWGDLGLDPAPANPASRGEVPHPIDLLLPREVRIHPFTGRLFGEEGEIKGIEVSVEARDAYDDATKAFGTFRFELYAYRRDRPDERGPRIATWTESLLDARDNARHWDMIAKRYSFKLALDRPIAVGHRFVLTVDFTSPFTDRISDQHAFIAGQ
ncbi:MAG: hypothetical protein KGY99_10330 [Phycisphaerae bacterium]|nr:hypothetical protein [Phycisphaerae bacterium]